MKHLTIDQIISFVSLCKLDEQALELSCLVNEHIRECSDCLQQVRSFQDVYDEFLRIQSVGDFKSFAYSIVPENMAAAKEMAEIEREIMLES